MVAEQLWTTVAEHGIGERFRPAGGRIVQLGRDGVVIFSSSVDLDGKPRCRGGQPKVRRVARDKTGRVCCTPLSSVKLSADAAPFAL